MSESRVIRYLRKHELDLDPRWFDCFWILSLLETLVDIDAQHCASRSLPELRATIQSPHVLVGVAAVPDALRESAGGASAVDAGVPSELRAMLLIRLRAAFLASPYAS